MSQEITPARILATAIAKVHFCDQEGELSKDELIIALCEKYLDEAIAHGMTISAEMTRHNPSSLNVDAINRAVLANEILTARDNKVWRKDAAIKEEKK